MWNLKKKKSTNELIYKTERITDFENKLMVTKGETWEEKTNQESRINKYTIYTLYTLYIKYIHYIHPIHKIINKDLLYTTGSPTQYSAITYMQKEPEKEQIYVYIYRMNLFAVHLKLTQHCKSTIRKKFLKTVSNNKVSVQEKNFIFIHTHNAPDARYFGASPPTQTNSPTPTGYPVIQF